MKGFHPRQTEANRLFCTKRTCSAPKSYTALQQPVYTYAVGPCYLATYLVALQTAGLGAVRTEVWVLQSVATDVALEEFVQALLRGEKDIRKRRAIDHYYM